MDAGLAAGEHLAGLLGMGYWPDTQAANWQTTTARRAHRARGAAWDPVGDNAAMALIGEHRLPGCP